MVGAYLDTLEAERAGELDHILHQRLEIDDKAKLSPDVKARNRAAKWEAQRMKTGKQVMQQDTPMRATPQKSHRVRQVSSRGATKTVV